ncbi:MAG: 2-oxoacid:ferredoxin oxidoreductase subunit gamma [Candidatus Omnitrophica bacterium]|nr:2-oxoacid:ferredoxin oxidoreductase subunit gamma [Candidatus Omnitrophota bacterium]
MPDLLGHVAAGSDGPDKRRGREGISARSDQGRNMKSKVKESIICAGFGGQGIMTLGKVLAQAGMMIGLNVTWMPSYGAEVRGGTAHSMVKISSDPIGSPLVTEADTAVIMNAPSLEKFEARVRKGGLVILNESMCSGDVKAPGIDAVKAPLTDEAIALGNVRVANMIAAGIFASRKGLFGKEVLIEVVKILGAGRKQIIPVNIKAVEKGFQIDSSLAGSVKG